MADVPLLALLQDQNPWWREPASRRALRYPARREVQIDLRRRLEREDRRACVVVGPRQVGKTVALLQLADDLLDAGLPPANLTYFDFSDDRLTAPVTARDLESVRPTGFQVDAPRILLLDEIGRAQNWDLWLKQAVDQRTARIVATDSQARILRQGARESGLGRWDEVVVEGLTYPEFIRLHARGEEGEDQVLLRRPALHEQFLALGGFPEHAYSEDYAEVRQRLREDIAERAILHDLLASGVEVQRVKDLFVYLIQDSGSTFTAARRARDLTPPADARSVQAWLELLTGTLLLAELDRCRGSAAGRLRSAPRVYAADHGLINAFAVAPTRGDRVRGQAAEAVVFRHLRELVRREAFDLCYFREADDMEVDFVVDTGQRRIAIEVTANRDIRSDKIAALRRVRKRLKPDRTLLVYGGAAGNDLEGIEVVPIAELLQHSTSIVRGV